MQQSMDEVSRKRAAAGRPTCQIGIGVHTGDVSTRFHLIARSEWNLPLSEKRSILAVRYSDGAKGLNRY